MFYKEISSFMLLVVPPKNDKTIEEFLDELKNRNINEVNNDINDIKNKFKMEIDILPEGSIVTNDVKPNRIRIFISENIIKSYKIG